MFRDQQSFFAAELRNRDAESWKKYETANHADATLHPADIQSAFAEELRKKDIAQRNETEQAILRAEEQAALHRIQAMAAATILVWSAIKKAGNDEEENKAAQRWAGHPSQRQVREIVKVVFEGGPLGFEWDQEGIVYKVEATGQGRKARVSVGMCIDKINEWAYNASVLRRCISGGEPFEITFSLPDGVHRDDLSMTARALRKLRMFQEASCGEKFLEFLALQCEDRSYQEGQLVMEAQDRFSLDRSLFLIQTGSVNVMSPSGEEVVATLGRGSALGEQRLLGLEQSAKQVAPVCAADWCRVLVLDQSAVVKALELYPEERVTVLDMAFKAFYNASDFEDSPEDTNHDYDVDRVRRFVVTQAVRQSPRFSKLSSAFIADLSRYTTTYVKLPGEAVMEQGTAGDSMFVMISGSATVQRSSRIVATLGPGAFFGELGMLGVVLRRSASVIADSLVCLWEVGNDGFETVLPCHPEMKQEFKQFVTFALEYSIPDRFDNLRMFRSFNRAFTRSLCTNLSRRVHFSGTNVFSEGQVAEGYFLLNEGEGLLTRRGVIIEKCKPGHQLNTTVLLGGAQKNDGTLTVLRCSHFLILTFDSYWQSVISFRAWDLHKALAEKIKQELAEHKLKIRQNLHDNLKDLTAAFRMGMGKEGQQGLQSIFKIWAAYVVLQSEVYNASARLDRLSAPKAQRDVRLTQAFDQDKDLPSKQKKGYQTSTRLAELCKPRVLPYILLPPEPVKRLQKSPMRIYKVCARKNKDKWGDLHQTEFTRPRSPRGIDRYA